MSARRSLASLGQPYFLAGQENLAYMEQANGPSGREVLVQVEVLLRELPRKRSSIDETHVLASFHQPQPGAATAKELAYIGITPSGRIVCSTVGQSSATQTNQAVIAADGKFHSISFSQHDDEAGGFWHYIDVDNVRQVAVARTYTLVQPDAGALGRFSLFQGIAAATRCACEIRRAAFFFGSVLGSVLIGSSVTWEINELSGTTLAPTIFAGTLPPPAWTQNADLSLTLEYFSPFYNPLFGLPWGDFPTSLADAYAWVSRTAYTPRGIKQPSYREAKEVLA